MWIFLMKNPLSIETSAYTNTENALNGGTLECRVFEGNLVYAASIFEVTHC